MGYRLIVSLMLAVLVARADHALAESTFPGPLPGQADPIMPFPPVTGLAASAACMEGFVPLREDAEKRGKLIKEASERHAPPQEACALIGSYALASAKMVKYAEANAVECGIPASIVRQLKAGHRKTEELRAKVCAVVEQIGKRGGSGQINDFGDPAFQPRGPAGDVPDAKGRN
jgi:hypothetical protein